MLILVWYNIPISGFAKIGMSVMTEREAQIEALWTYEVATEKVLRRSVKKEFITQEEADTFSEKLFEQLNTDNIPGFRLSLLGDKIRAEDIRVNPYVSLAEIAREKKSSRDHSIGFATDTEPREYKRNFKCLTLKTDASYFIIVTSY